MGRRRRTNFEGAASHYLNWFEGARIAVAVAADDEEFDIKGRKLSAIFQFAKAMPNTVFVPASSNQEMIRTPKWITRRERGQKSRIILQAILR